IPNAVDCVFVRAAPKGFLFHIVTLPFISLPVEIALIIFQCLVNDFGHFQGKNISAEMLPEALFCDTDALHLVAFDLSHISSMSPSPRRCSSLMRRIRCAWERDGVAPSICMMLCSI